LRFTFYREGQTSYYVAILNLEMKPSRTDCSDA
jgi:hypothetical protein